MKAFTRHFLLCMLILNTAFLLSGEILLTRERPKMDYEYRLYAERGIKYYIYASRVDNSVTRSIGVSLVAYYHDSAGKTRNRTFYLSSGDRFHEWEFSVRENISVYSIEALRLTDNTHEWLVWIEEIFDPSYNIEHERKDIVDSETEERDDFSELSGIERYRIDVKDILVQWDVGEKKLMGDNAILRLEGENKDGFLTNIMYKTMDQRIKEIEEEKSRSDDIKRRIQFNRDHAKGGVIILYVEREIDWKAEGFVFSLLDSRGRQVVKEKVKGYPGPMLSRDHTYYYNTIFYWIPEKFNTRGGKFVFKDGGWTYEHSGNEKFEIVIRNDHEHADEIFRFRVFINPDPEDKE